MAITFRGRGHGIAGTEVHGQHAADRGCIRRHRETPAGAPGAGHRRPAPRRHWSAAPPVPARAPLPSTVTASTRLPSRWPRTRRSDCPSCGMLTGTSGCGDGWTRRGRCLRSRAVPAHGTDHPRRRVPDAGGAVGSRRAGGAVCTRTTGCPGPSQSIRTMRSATACRARPPAAPADSAGGDAKPRHRLAQSPTGAAGGFTARGSPSRPCRRRCRSRSGRGRSPSARASSPAWR